MHPSKQSAIVLYLLLLCILILTACQDRASSNAMLLYRADTCMALQSDSALYHFRQIKQPTALTGEEQAHYCLLMTQAMDKNELSLKSDSLIQIAVNYYTHNGSATNRAKALFYKGRVLEEQGDVAGATYLYKQVETMIPQVDDYYLISLVYSSLGYLNQDSEHYTEALAYYDKALLYDRKSDKPVLIATGLQDLAKIHLDMGNKEKADSLFKETLSYLPNVDPAWQSNIYQNISVFYWITEQSEQAEQAIKKALSRSKDPKERLLSYAMLLPIYTKQQKKEEVDSLRLEILKSGNVYAKSLIYNSLLKEAITERNFQQIEEYVPLYIQYTDSIHQLSQDKRILEIQSKYNRDLLIQQNEINLLLLCTGTLLLLLLLVSLIYLFKKYRRYRHVKELELLKQQRTFQELETLHCELISELAHYHFLDKNGCILDDCYTKVVTYYSLYNPQLVHFLRDANLALTPYEIILCVFSYEHLPMEQLEQILGKTRGTLNKAISRAKDKLIVVAKKDGWQKVGPLGDFLRAKF